MFKKLIKINYHRVGLESGKCLTILKPCGCHPRQSRSQNHTLESVKLAEINKKANYAPPAAKNPRYRQSKKQLVLFPAY